MDKIALESEMVSSMPRALVFSSYNAHTLGLYGIQNKSITASSKGLLLKTGDGGCKFYSLLWK